MSVGIQAADVADLPQAQAVLVRQHTAGNTAQAFQLNVLVADLPAEVVGLGDLQGQAGETLDQRVEGVGRQDQSQGGTFGVLGDVLGAAAVFTGQAVGILVDL